MNTGIDSLIAEITTAFDGVSREDGITLHEAEEMDCHGTPEELRKARQRDTEQRWQDIPEEWIGKFPSAFNFMDPKGLRYYLPAVMIWHFRHTHWSEPASADVIRTLLCDVQFAYDQLPELFALLSEYQRRATAHWLLFYAQNIGYEEARPKEIAIVKSSIWGIYLR